MSPNLDHHLMVPVLLLPASKTVKSHRVSKNLTGKGYRSGSKCLILLGE